MKIKWRPGSPFSYIYFSDIQGFNYLNHTVTPSIYILQGYTSTCINKIRQLYFPLLHRDTSSRYFKAILPLASLRYVNFTSTLLHRDTSPRYFKTILPLYFQMLPLCFFEILQGDTSASILKLLPLVSFGCLL
jgi:hypothetical protein